MAKFGIDDEVSTKKRAFEALPAGVYDFVVESVRVDLYDVQPKTSAGKTNAFHAYLVQNGEEIQQERAAYTLSCTDAEGREGMVVHRIFLNEYFSNAWDAFALGCGVPKGPDGTRRFSPGGLVGKAGKCRLARRTYRQSGEERTANDVELFMDASGVDGGPVMRAEGAAKAPASPAAAQAAGDDIPF